MKYFVIEGIIKDSNLTDEKIMKKHMSYTQKAIDDGLILMSTLKTDMSGGLFIMKSESIEKLEEYLFNEPLKTFGVQDYKVIEFSPHYFNKSSAEWFDD
ncbi:hypothetical protein GSQ54_17065 [Clostridioides difficile]|nr:hypothetical protein [Clostridioides difficile]